MEDAWYIQGQQKLARLVSFLPKEDAGLVRTMDKTRQGTWMAKKRRQEPLIRVRRLRHRRKGGMQVGGVDVDDEWVSKLHKRRV